MVSSSSLMKSSGFLGWKIGLTCFSLPTSLALKLTTYVKISASKHSGEIFGLPAKKRRSSLWTFSFFDVLSPALISLKKRTKI
jgi:hypothetical protein